MSENTLLVSKHWVLIYIINDTQLIPLSFNVLKMYSMLMWKENDILLAGRTKMILHFFKKHISLLKKSLIGSENSRGDVILLTLCKPFIRSHGHLSTVIRLCSEAYIDKWIRSF